MKSKLPYTKVAAIQVKPLSEGSFHVFLKVKLNGKSALFILDTGASGSVIDLNFYTQKLLLKPKSIKQEVHGLNSIQYEMKFGAVKETQIGKLNVKNAKFSCLDLNHINNAYSSKGLKIKIHGILGSDILNKHQLLIDYKHSLIGRVEE
jgi:hypothetical protein